MEEWFGKSRSLTAIKICLFDNLYRNSVTSALLMFFSQLAQSHEVRQIILRGSKIARHHCAIFRKFLVIVRLILNASMSEDLLHLSQKIRFLMMNY
ncbi:DUF3231 family protein [Streptomyces vietnamensis]|uniref:DUF3231 family protein n=1 Tax=Bacillati TaxID=1783272 RepID=UPI003443A6FD